ncbi:hypothetical protein D3C78_1235390 [compost metagenome]
MLSHEKRNEQTQERFALFSPPHNGYLCRHRKSASRFQWLSLQATGPHKIADTSPSKAATLHNRPPERGPQRFLYFHQSYQSPFRTSSLLMVKEYAP